MRKPRTFESLADSLAEQVQATADSLRPYRGDRLEVWCEKETLTRPQVAQSRGCTTSLMSTPC